MIAKRNINGAIDFEFDYVTANVTLFNADGQKLNLLIDVSPHFIPRQLYHTAISACRRVGEWEIAQQLEKKAPTNVNANIADCTIIAPPELAGMTFHQFVTYNGIEIDTQQVSSEIIENAVSEFSANLDGMLDEIYKEEDDDDGKL